MLSVLERNILLEHIDNQVDRLWEGEGKIFVKALSNYVHFTFPTANIPMDESIFADKSSFKDALTEIIKVMVEVQGMADVKMYTTGQLSKFFGVSVTSINNWIEQGRFIGVKRESKNKQARISDITLWRSDTNGLIPVRAIVEIYETQQEERTAGLKVPKDKLIKEEIRFFEEKYGGEYEETLMKISNKSPEQQRDEFEWKYWLGGKGDD